MRIQTNAAALGAYRNLSTSSMAMDKQIQKLSSGFRINRSADDAAGLSIANKMRSDNRALQMASRNASQAGSLLSIADGAVQTLSSILDRMKELATQSSSANVTDSDRAKIDAEFSSLKTEITRITDNTQYQGSTLLKGSFGSQLDTAASSLYGSSGVSNINVSGLAASTTVTLAQSAATAVTATIGTSGTAGFKSQTIATSAGSAGVSQSINFDQLGVSFTYTGVLGATTLNGLDVETTAAAAATFRVGAGTGTDSEINLSLGDLSLSGLGLSSQSLASQTTAETAMSAIDSALGVLNTTVGTIGAAQNRLDFATANLASMQQNTAAAESVIRDADMAFEMVQFTKNQVLSQAGQAMLAQANQSSQGVLSLLRG